MSDQVPDATGGRGLDDRRVYPGADPGEDPREIDEEYTDPEILGTWRAQEGMVHPAEGGEGMGTSSDTSPGSDLPRD